jgi:hypothetical protein
MKLFASVFFLITAIAPQLFAEAVKTFKHTKAKFSVQYPAAWTLAPEKEGAPFMATAPDGAANVQVMTDVLKGNMTACEYLTKTEAAAEGGRTNLIPESKRRATPVQLKFMGVKDGCVGAYKITAANAEVLQGTGVYTSGKKVWVLIQTLQTAAKDRHGKSIGDIAKSFTTK